MPTLADSPPSVASRLLRFAIPDFTVAADGLGASGDAERAESATCKAVPCPRAVRDAMRPSIPNSLCAFAAILAAN